MAYTIDSSKASQGTSATVSPPNIKGTASQGTSATVAPLNTKGTASQGTSATVAPLKTKGTAVLGLSVTLPFNAIIGFSLENFVTIIQPFTVTFSWSGHNAEITNYDSNFVFNREFPLNTAITFQTGGTGYAIRTSIVTFTSEIPVNVTLVVAGANLNSYHRRHSFG